MSIKEPCCLQHCCFLNGCNCSDPNNGKVFDCCVESSIGAPYNGNECYMPGGCHFTRKHVCCPHSHPFTITGRIIPKQNIH